MNKNLVIIGFVVIWSILAAFTLTLGVTLNYPDYLHVNYGSPLVWGTHTLNTIAGPVDKWQVDPYLLLSDLAFWFGWMIVIEIVLLYFIKR